ncbi:MAG: hypothetical protein K9H16_04380 [Bacteroidales bacterium]|nr:hypothetical protein [Bacteroidales bacterium]
MNNLSRLSVLMLAALLLFSCNSKQDQKTKNDISRFNKIVSSYPSGLVSSGSSLLITLAAKVEKYNPGTELPENLMNIEPSVSGKLLLLDPHTVEFRPDQPLKNGQDYTVDFKVGELVEVPEKLGVFEFKVSVIYQDFTVYRGKLASDESINKPTKRYDGKMVTADDMNVDDAARLLLASSPNGNLNIDVEAVSPKEFSYSIKDIPREQESYLITVNWNGSPIGLDKKGMLEVEIPAIDEFKLLQVNVSQESLNQSVELIFSDPVDPNQDLSGLIRFRDFDQAKLSAKANIVTIYPKQRMLGEQTIIIEKSIRNTYGSVLDKKTEYLLSMEALKPEVSILGNGVIMPDSRNLILSFKAVSLRAVDVLVYKIYTQNIMQFFQYNDYHGQSQLRYVGRPVYRKMVKLDENPGTNLQQWNAFSVDLTGMINSDPNAMYRVKISFRQPYTLYDCDTDSKADLSEFEDLPLMKSEEEAFYNGNDEYYYDYPENYRWRERDDPCSNSYYTQDRFPERNLLASNLGIIAKSADGKKFTVAVTDLLTAGQVSSANVKFFNFQQQNIGETSTASDGMATIMLSEHPYLIVVQKGDQQSWLRIDDGSSLSLSNFDVSGQKISKGIKGTMYGERGVWRPGDTLFLTFVMDDLTNKLPEGHPVVFELYNSQGQLAKREVQNYGTNGFYTFRPVTDTEAPTGNWTARVYVGGATFDKQIKIETIKPNRLKINLSFNKEILSKSEPGQTGALDVKWLHGADAAKLRAQVDMQLYKSEYAFEGYEKFCFSDASKEYWPSENTVFNGSLDATGKTSFPLDMYVNYGAPGMLKAVFSTRVFEDGGDFSTDVFSLPFAPYDRFVGVHVPAGGDYQNMLSTDTSHLVEVMTVDKFGNPVDASNLEVRIYRVSWRWWWSSGSDNLASWLRGQNAELLVQKTVSTKNGKGSFNFRIDYPSWGRFFIQVNDPDGGHSAGIPVYIDWPSYISRKDRNNPAGATILSIASDKETYIPGEEAKLTFPASADAMALISIETGSEILKYYWVPGNELQNGFAFDITGDMAPNIFAYVTLLQPHAQTLNDLPIRMYGVIPLMVEDPLTILKPMIEAPDEIRPKEEYQIKISEENGMPMTYTLAVVDEGLLDITRFKTPDLWQYFYAREALGIKTWDLYDDVMGAFGGNLQKVLAIGGDDQSKVDKEKKPNRFKPVVKYLGPFELKKNKTAMHKLTMPNYVGSVKIMVVAGQHGAYGSADQTVPVRQPLMVLPTAPRVIGPDEEFNLPVSVFAMKDNLQNVKIKVVVEGLLSIDGDETRELQFDKMGEKMTFFKLKGSKYEGAGKITVSATSGKESASADIEIGIRNPNAHITKVETQIINPGESKSIAYDFFGMKGTNSGTIEISGMPSFDLDKNLKYLIRYPYGCVEQVTSSVFPQLFLDELTELNSKQKAEINHNITQAIKKLGQYQLANGGMSYWPGQRYISNWGSTYAWHFLLLAEQKGYLIPSGFKKRWVDWQFAQASDFPVNGHQYHSYNYDELSQAYRLYTLALAGKPNLSAMNRLRESDNLSNTSRWRLAGAYILAGMPEAAKGLTENSSFTETNIYDAPGYTFGSTLRDQAMILEVLVLMGKDEDAFGLANKMADEMRTSYLSTQTAAFSLYAMARFASGTGQSRDNHFEYELAGKKDEINTKIPIYSIPLSEDENPEKTISVKNLAENKLYITKTISGRPLQGEESDESKNLEMSVKYVGVDGKALEVTTLKQGTDFEAVVTIKNPGQMGNYENLALAQVFPSGWEILNLRFTEAGNSGEENTYDYRDIRDDRVLTFFNLKPQKQLTFKVSLNAAYTGKFYLPATSCHAMYDNKIYARKRGQWVEVVRE